MRRLLLLAALTGALGCSGSAVCRVSADCASGVCRSDGTCAPPGSGSASGGSSGAATSAGATSGSSTSSGGSGGTTSSGGTTGASGGTSSSTGSTSTSGTTGSASCLPDGDAMVQRSEVNLQPGLHATFRVALDAGFDTAGSSLPDGGTSWDFTVSLPGDQDTVVTTNALDGGWYAADFPDASYTTPLSASSDLLGVFQESSDALLLLGVVSPSPGSTQTELTYDPPVTVLQFPISPGASWSTTASLVSGEFQGLSSAYYETYQSTVDAQGSVHTPYARFPALRVNTLLTRNVGGVVSYTRTFAFVTDCFGTVAQVSSDSVYGVPPPDDFSEAAELRRLAP